jgi:hypothetical protein
MGKTLYLRQIEFYRIQECENTLTSKINNKLQATLIVTTALLACFLIMGAATAQTYQNSPPADFNGVPPFGDGGNMTNMPDFNGSDTFGNDRPMPSGGFMGDFNGTMPFPSGSPGDMNGQLNPQTTAASNQTNYLVIIIVGVVVAAVAIAVVAVTLKHKRKTAT